MRRGQRGGRVLWRPPSGSTVQFLLLFLLYLTMLSGLREAEGKVARVRSGNCKKGEGRKKSNW
jgi:hypothetical protein